MGRWVAPDKGVRETVIGNRTYRPDNKGIYTVENAAAQRAMKAEGFFEASLNPYDKGDANRGFTCVECGFGTAEDWNNRNWLISNIEKIHDAMDKMKETFSGREELRTNGWIIEETDPELAKQAKWLADERKREYDAWVASIERNYTEENSSVYSAD